MRDTRASILLEAAANMILKLLPRRVDQLLYIASSGRADPDIKQVGNGYVITDGDTKQ